MTATTHLFAVRASPDSRPLLVMPDLSIQIRRNPASILLSGFSPVLRDQEPDLRDFMSPAILHPVYLVVHRDFRILGVILAETLPIDAVEDGAAIAALVRAHLEAIDIPIFAAPVGPSTMKAPKVI